VKVFLAGIFPMYGINKNKKLSTGCAILGARFFEGVCLTGKLALFTHDSETLRDKARLTDKPFAISGHKYSLYRLFTNFTNFHYEFPFYFRALSIC
jgi:hypothetical protein